MLLKGVKSKTIQKRIIKKYEQNQAQNNKYNSKIEKVLLLIEDGAKDTTPELIRKKFDWKENVVSTLIYVDLKQSDLIEDNTFSVKDLNWFGKLKSASVKECLDQEFDVCINLVSNELGLLISLESNAKFRVGVDEQFANFYDLTIALESGDLNIFVDELKRYLEILNKI